MANHKSAEKRNRQRIKRRARNLSHLSRLRTYMKRVRKAVDGGGAEANDPATLKGALADAVKVIGKGASKGVLHKNTASRYISRLTKAVAKATAAN